MFSIWETGYCNQRMVSNMLGVGGIKMSYNFDANNCDKCGISKEELKKRFDNSMSYTKRMHQGSFSLGVGGSVLCPDCQKKKLLSEILD